ncbi:DUF397 domain-containing protein [Streptomyces sp. Z26]|uniref:DUF397 domain-containing protein n=1 Tax=Streptomyces TaxID=1883 RepID=UPI000EF13EDA|nr:DUF397 domain-containing protein [Streptomyces sp. Z26]RLL65994.1 DUF397 domain-containing protein [Streptomyces sp. Z26]
MRDLDEDLYGEDLSGATWARPCASQTEICVEVAALSGGGWALRDSKRPDLPALRFTEEEIREFVQEAPRLFSRATTD